MTGGAVEVVEMVRLVEALEAGRHRRSLVFPLIREKRANEWGTLGIISESQSDVLARWVGHPP